MRLYILTEAAKWDFSEPTSLLLSIWLRPWAHAWIMLESPGGRLEFGHTGDFGLAKPRYHEGVMQRARDGDPNPIGYLWQTMSDGQFQLGKPNRPPTFVWRMPITGRRYQLLYEYAMQRKYDQFGVRTNNCTDMVAEMAALAGINLSPPHSPYRAAGNEGVGSDAACLDGPTIPHPGVQHARSSGTGSAPPCPDGNRE